MFIIMIRGVLMEKKGQGLSMNVIIIAALALLVLVVLAIIFMGKMGGTVGDMRKCESMGGRCVPIGEQCPVGWSKAGLNNVACLDSEGEVDSTMQCCIVGEN
jgi:hypothetical protein